MLLAMTKMRQQEEYYPFHKHVLPNDQKGSLIMCNSVERRDESPVSVILQSPTAPISQPSSCGSMEHLLNQYIISTTDHHANFYPFQEQSTGASSTSEDDHISLYNLPNLSLKMGVLEEVPEAQKLDLSKAFSRTFPEGRPQNINLAKSFEEKSLTCDKDLADSSNDDDEHFSIDFQGLQDKSMVLRERFFKVSKSKLDDEEERKAHDKLSAKLKQYGEWKKGKLIKTPNGHLIREEESIKPISMGFLKTVNFSDNAWVRGFDVVQKKGNRPQLVEGANFSNLSIEKSLTRRERGEIITSSKALVSSKWDDAEKWLCHNNSASINQKVNYSALQRQLSDGIYITAGRGNLSTVNVSCKGDHSCASQSPVPDEFIPGRRKIKDNDGLILDRKRIKDNAHLFHGQPARDYNSLGSVHEIMGANFLTDHGYSPSNNRYKYTAAISASDSNINANYASDQQDKRIANHTKSFKQHQILQKLRQKCISINGGRDLQMSTQDKYADTHIDGKLDQDNVRKIEFIMQSPKHGRSASIMKDACTEISPSISRRDMGTQMSPLGSSLTSNCASPINNNSPARHNTPTRRSSTNINTNNHGINHGKDQLNLLELESCHLDKLELRDLPSGDKLFQSFDHENSTVSSINEQSPTKLEEEDAVEINDYEVNTNTFVRFHVLEARAAAWKEAERAKFHAKYKREEARIDSWENLQRAKAQAVLKKLEVKLEKLRSQATEKVMKKVRATGRRAEEMRAAAEAERAEQMRRVKERVANLRKNAHVRRSFGVCFARNYLP